MNCHGSGSSPIGPASPMQRAKLAMIAKALDIKAAQ
jgi:hypothetical protein